MSVSLMIRCIIWLAICQVIVLPYVSAQNMLPRQACNNIVYVKAQELENYFDFSESPLKAIAKVTITYCTVNGGSLGPELPYETLWYNGSQPLGCRRYRDFDIVPLNTIYVYLNSSSAVSHAAAANALVRILFDAKSNRNSITAVEIPSDSFKLFITQMQKENFYTPGKAPASFMPAYLYLPMIDNIGEKQTVIYAGNP